MLPSIRSWDILAYTFAKLSHVCLPFMTTCFASPPPPPPFRRAKARRLLETGKATCSSLEIAAFHKKRGTHRPCFGRSSSTTSTIRYKRSVQKRHPLEPLSGPAAFAELLRSFRGIPLLLETALMHTLARLPLHS